MAMTSTEPDASAPAAVAGAGDLGEPRSEPVATVGTWASGNDHKTIGKLFLLGSVASLVVGGVLALLLRAQLASPDQDLLNPDRYRHVFTYHGIIMVFLFLLPAWLGLASVLVPLQIGATRMAFPRLHAFALWLFLAGAAMIVASPFAPGGTPGNGWALDSPVPVGRDFRGDGFDILVLGLAVVAAAAVLVAVNLLVTVLTRRIEGLTLRRLPLFSWSVTVASSVLLVALPVLVAAMAMLFVDRHYGGRLFSGFTGSRGGNSLLWARLVWFALYPMLWALLLPALGAISEIVAVFARRPLVGRKQAIGAFAMVGVLSFAGFGPEAGNLSGGRILFAAGRLAVLGPVALLVLLWLATVAAGRRELRGRRVRAVPPLLAVGFVTLLAVGLLGGLGAALGSREYQRDYWAVAAQHTLFFGSSTVALVAALHYWAPKLWGRHLSQGLGSLQALLLVGGLHLTFLPAYVLGLQDMPRRLSVLRSSEDWEVANAVASAGAVVVALGVVVLALDLLLCIAGRGRRADDDPWDGHTLEWATTSPPPAHDFDALPEVRSETPVLDLATASVSAGPPTPAPESGEESH